MNKDTRPGLRLSYAQLLKKGQRVSELIERDIDKFRRFSVNEKELAKFRKNLTQFKAIPTDKEMQRNKTLITKRKNEFQDLVRDRLREILVRAKISYGDSSSKYRNLKVNNLSRLRNDELLNVADFLIDFIRENYDDFKEHGLHDIEFKQIIENRDRYRKSLHDQKLADTRRNSNTKKRSKMGSEIYQTMANYCDIGKRIWKDDEPRRKQYIIFPSQAGQKSRKSKNEK